MKPVDLSANIEILKENKQKDNVKANPIKPITHIKRERRKRNQRDREREKKSNKKQTFSKRAREENKKLSSLAQLVYKTKQVTMIR